MILYEFEGKQLLLQAGIQIPASQLIDSPEEEITLKFPVVLKAQVLSGKRADAGGILFAENAEEAKTKLQELLGTTINKEKVEKVLVEEKVEIKSEYYVSLSYDTDTRGPVLTISASGGTGIEERKASSYKVNPLTMSIEESQNNLYGLSGQLISDLIKLFLDQDCLLLEINPLVKTKNGEWMALDAKVKLDETALKRHETWQFPPRGVPGYTPTKNEIAAKKIDEEDYRGTAGSTYFDLPGDIAILTSGGGGSLTAMDTLFKTGGKPADYTEYSGNPPREKVEKLTEIVLSNPGLHGLWVVGAIANLTDIYETLSGFVEGLRNVREKLGIKLDFPIVIRRAGPRDKEAFEMLIGVKDFDLHLYNTETSIAQSAVIVRDLAKEYAEKGGS